MTLCCIYMRNHKKPGVPEERRNDKAVKTEFGRAEADPYLQTIVTFILSNFSPRRIILFGSRANGTQRPDSDYDIAIEMDDTGRSISRLRYEQGLTDHAIDFVVMRSFSESGSLVAKEILTSGVVLYEK